jgi:hypothetical protein
MDWLRLTAKRPILRPPAAVWQALKRGNRIAIRGCEFVQRAAWCHHGMNIRPLGGIIRVPGPLITLHNMRTFAFVAALAFAILLMPDSFAQERRVALVLGNDAYPSAKLKNSSNDAKAIAASLKALDFDVILRTNVKQREMGRAIIEFGRKIRPGDIAFFYFAGHGIQARGKNFLIPIDADIESEAEVRAESVDVDAVLDQLVTARLSIIILDACRNNPFESRFRRAGGAGLAQVDAPTGSILAYSTAPGKTASDGADGNGLYTSALLKAVEVPGLKIEDVFKQVRIEVIKASAGQQIPWESSSLTNEFVFRPASAEVVENQKLKRARDEQEELLKEMQMLKAELLAMKQSLALASPPAAAIKSIPPAPVEQAKPPPATPVSLPLPAAQQSGPEEWSARIAAIEKLQKGLNLSKALALLLDVTSDNDLTLLVAHEAYIRQLSWPTSYALGVDANGDIIWGIASNWKAEQFSAETAIEFCARKPGDNCKLVLHNWRFDVKDFLSVAKSLGAKSVSSVRSDFLQHIAQPPVETISMSAGPMRPQMGITFRRDP